MSLLNLVTMISDFMQIIKAQNEVLGRKAYRWYTVLYGSIGRIREVYGWYMNGIMIYHPYTYIYHPYTEYMV